MSSVVLGRGRGEPGYGKEGSYGRGDFAGAAEAESGETVVEVCRKHGISQQSPYLWKKKYAGLGLNELRELRQLREENNKLKRLVADLRLTVMLKPEGWEVNGKCIYRLYTEEGLVVRTKWRMGSPGPRGMSDKSKDGIS